MATLYEIAISFPKEKRKEMAEAGFISPNIERYIYIYEMWLTLLSQGMRRMDAYTTISERCYTSEDNVRKIIQKMGADKRLPRCR